MQVRYKTIVVDDERPVRNYTKHILAQFPEVFEVVAEAGSGQEAVQVIQLHQPDLVFLDIQMPDLTGFQVLQQLSRPPMVVFLTAYDHFAVKAFEENGLDYLLKPLEESRLKKTIVRINEYHAGVQARIATINFGQLEALLQASLMPQQKASTITVKQGNKILLLDLADVVALISTEKYTAIKTVDGKSFLDAKTLTAFEQELPNDFLRVQKGAIINTRHIREIQKHFNNRYNIFLKDKEATMVLTGHTYAAVVRDKLGIGR
jgi:two-component system LytT family response regulator